MSSNLQETFIARAAKAGYEIKPAVSELYEVSNHNHGTPTPEQHRYQEEHFLEQLVEQSEKFVEQYGENWKPNLWSKIGDKLRLW